MSTFVHNDQQPHDVWLTAFSEADRRQQLSDDSAAWSRVTGVLMVVVTLGLLISIIGVICAQLAG